MFIVKAWPLISSGSYTQYYSKEVGACSTLENTNTTGLPP